MATSSEAKVSLKLLIDTKGKRVLFAEAGKDFVDLLFNLLQLPLGTVASLLKEEKMVGTLGNLYESIENLSETYFQPTRSKQSVLNPKPPISSNSDANPLLMLHDVSQSFYICHYSYDRCSRLHCYVSNDSSAVCPECKERMNKEVSYVTKEGVKNEGVLAAGEGGFVKGVVTYMIMDDLVVTPMSTISGITMLNKFNVKDVGALEERFVHLEMTEALKLLKSSLHSSTVLTSVFLENTGA